MSLPNISYFKKKKFFYLPISLHCNIIKKVVYCRVIKKKTLKDVFPNMNNTLTVGASNPKYPPF